MTLDEFLLNINDLVDENPDILDCTVIYSIDDEGNAFHKVLFEPTLGFYDNDQGEFDADHTVNSICIN